jgi:hypothetical protein
MDRYDKANSLFSKLLSKGAYKLVNLIHIMCSRIVNLGVWYFVISGLKENSAGILKLYGGKL